MEVSIKKNVAVLLEKLDQKQLFWAKELGYKGQSEFSRFINSLPSKVENLTANQNVKIQRILDVVEAEFNQKLDFADLTTLDLGVLSKNDLETMTLEECIDFLKSGAGIESVPYWKRPVVKKWVIVSTLGIILLSIGACARLWVMKTGELQGTFSEPKNGEVVFENFKACGHIYGLHHGYHIWVVLSKRDSLNELRYWPKERLPNMDTRFQFAPIQPDYWGNWKGNFIDHGEGELFDLHLFAVPDSMNLVFQIWFTKGFRELSYPGFKKIDGKVLDSVHGLKLERTPKSTD